MYHEKCPYCAEVIQDEAIKCKHCGEFLDGSGPPRIPASNLPWYFRTTMIVIALLSVGPLALPMIWWHPRLNNAWKVGITVITLAVTWIAYQSTMDAYRMLDEQMKVLRDGGLL